MLGHTKSTQLKRIARWLSKESLPGFIGSYHEINLWTRKTATGEPAFVMVNSSLMEAEGVELYIRTKDTRLVVTGIDAKSTEIRSKGTDGAYTIFTLPTINTMSAAPARVIVGKK